MVAGSLTIRRASRCADLADLVVPLDAFHIGDQSAVTVTLMLVEHVVHHAGQRLFAKGESAIAILPGKRQMQRGDVGDPVGTGTFELANDRGDCQPRRDRCSDVDVLLDSTDGMDDDAE